jgi:hypothetical protein
MSTAEQSNVIPFPAAASVEVVEVESPAEQPSSKLGQILAEATGAGEVPTTEGA